MAVLPSNRIVNYYELFKSIDVAFSKEIIQVTGLVPNQIQLKCVGDVWPCVIYTSSFQEAKVVASLKSGILQKMERANNVVSLRFCFKVSEKGNPVTFFVNTKSTGHSVYGNSGDMAIFSLRFTQRPPDDLIEIMGRILDANINSVKLKDEHILINQDILRKLNIASKEGAIHIEGVPRNCILRDLSFFGAKFIMVGVAKFLVDKKAALKIDFEDPRESFLIEGNMVSALLVEGRKELIAVTMEFNESTVPTGYKIRINNYLSVVRADSRSNEKDEAKAKKAKPQGAEKIALTTPKAETSDSDSAADQPQDEAAAEEAPKEEAAEGEASPAETSAEGGDQTEEEAPEEEIPLPGADIKEAAMKSLELYK